MMRKFSKILALVLAFAMVLCPVLTAAAETESVVDPSTAVLEANITNNGPVTATLTVITHEEINAIDFKIKFAKGVTFNPETDTVKITEDSGDAAAWTVAKSYDDGVLTVVAFDNSDSMDVIGTELYFNITLTVDNASDYEFYLTKIFAVGAGAQGEDEIVCTFPCADNTQSGVIDVEAARNDCPGYIKGISCTHENVDEVETPATCTEAGSTVVTCKDCGAVVSSDPIEALGHSFVGTDATYRVVVEPFGGAAGYAVYNALCDRDCGTWNDAYFNEDGTVKEGVDFAALVADEDPNVEEVFCEPTTELTKDETGHWYVCACGGKHEFAEHTAGDAVEVERVDAQPGVAGYYVTVVTCTECGYEISRTTTEISALPVGPVLDETIAPTAHSVSIGETFGVGFRFDLSTISEEYVSFRLDIKRTSTAGDFNFTYVNESLTDFTKSNSNNLLRCRTTYYGIQLFSLTAPIEYTLHCFDKDGKEVAYSKTFTTTLADIAVTYHDLSTTSVAIKKVMADLVQVGAAALKHYTTNGTKACDYSTLPVPSIDSEYITTELGEMATFNSSEGIALTIAAAMQQNVYFNVRFAEKAENKEQYRYEISFKNALTGKEDPFVIEGSSLNSISNNTILTAKFETFPIFATNADVTFKLYKNGELVGTSHYCIDTYITDTLAKSSSVTLKALLQEIGELGQSIRTARGI